MSGLDTMDLSDVSDPPTSASEFNSNASQPPHGNTASGLNSVPLMADPMAVLAQSVNQLAVNQLQLQSLFHQIGTQQQNASATTPSGNIRAKEPRVFSGKATEVEPFLEELEICLSHQRRAITTDFDRAKYMRLYLGSGSPILWFRGVKTLHSEYLQDFEGLIRDFRKHFDDPDLTATMQRKLEKLTQKGSASDYAARFQEILFI